MEGRELKAFCEVKSPRDDWLEDQLDEAASGQFVEAPVGMRLTTESLARSLRRPSSFAQSILITPSRIFWCSSTTTKMLMTKTCLLLFVATSCPTVA